MVVDLGEPLLPDVLEGGGGSDTEADKEHIGLGIREGSKTIVIFLSGGIK